MKKILLSMLICTSFFTASAYAGPSFEFWNTTMSHDYNTPVYDQHGLRFDGLVCTYKKHRLELLTMTWSIVDSYVIRYNDYSVRICPTKPMYD